MPRFASAESYPAPADIIAARHALKMTQGAAGRIIYASLRTWQEWEGGRTRMHPAFWELFQIKTIAGRTSRTPRQAATS